MAMSTLNFDLRKLRASARSRIKLSRTSKLGCWSWSLAAFETCPGAIGVDGNAVDACAGCYARGGFYVMPDAKALRAFNREDWQREDFADDMVNALLGEEKFRWFDSGDMYSLALAMKMLDVMKRTPWVKHWLPTRMQKFAKFSAVIAAMQALPNVMVRWSADSVDGSHSVEHGSVIVPTAADAPVNATVCEAYLRGGKCGPCDACYDKTVKLIAYPAHGATMRKVIRLQLAA